MLLSLFTKLPVLLDNFPSKGFRIGDLVPVPGVLHIPTQRPAQVLCLPNPPQIP